MAIKELAEDLIAKLKTVTALGNRIGMASAGLASDPTMKTVPLPAVWLMYQGDTPTSGEYGFVEDIEYTFTAAVMVSYKDQADVLNTQLPFIENLAKSVSGKESTNFALRWKYQGAQLVDVFDDRQVYELRFAVSSSYQN